MLARVLLVHALPSAFVLTILVACNDHDPHPPPLQDPGSSTVPVGGSGGGTPTNTGSGGTSGTSGTTDAGECSALDDPTTVVDVLAVSDPIIAGTGGTIVDGTYDLTSVRQFVGASGQPGATGATYKEVLRITGGSSLERIQIVQTGQGAVASTTNYAFVLRQSTPPSTQFSLAQSCPIVGGATNYSYTAAGLQLTLVTADGAQEFTYNARP